MFTTCLLCGLFLSNPRFFSLSIHYSRLKKEAETKSGFSPRERRRRRSRLLCTTRRESSSSLYTRFPKSSCFCAHHHRRSRGGVVRDEAALFGTLRASILRVFLFALFKRTREREETFFFFFESPRKKSIYAHRRSRGVVVRDEAALFGTSILRVFLFALFKRTREREKRPFSSSSNLLIKKSGSFLDHPLVVL